MSQGASSSTAASKQQGIDLRDALEILGNRNRCNHQKKNSSSSNNSTEECQHCHKTKGGGMVGGSGGQVIDLFLPPPKGDDEKGAKRKDGKSDYSSSFSSSRTEKTSTREERVRELREELTPLSTSALVRTVLDTQAQRVVTYRNFDKGLNDLFSSSTASLEQSYPPLCAVATASFAALSDVMTTIRSILMERTAAPKSFMQHLDALQRQEKEKLNLTAAIHLEQIRERQEPDPTTQRLFAEGIKRLQGKIQSCVEAINETLEEMRYVLADMEEEGGDN